MPIFIFKDEPVSKALALMIEYDYSQLPVIVIEDGYHIPEGMITYEGILRGIRNFKAGIDDLKVRDVMIPAPDYSWDDDLFDILDRLKETNAVLITTGPDLTGIVTSYDTTEYFRNRTEDLMRVEDIELMIKEFIKTTYADESGEVDQKRLNDAVSQAIAYRTSNDPNEKRLTFDDLSLADYIKLLLSKETWASIGQIFGVQRNYVNELLNGVREIRNALAHFRGDLTAEQRDRLKFATEWLSRCQEQYEERVIKLEHGSASDLFQKKVRVLDSTNAELETEYVLKHPLPESSTDFTITEAATGGGRYAALADWLQSQPGRVDKATLNFNEIEDIIGSDLPASARTYRAWWSNDAVGHIHSQLWLDAGWRTTNINLTEGRITFSRVREREKAYIAYFSKLLDELRKKADFQVKDVSPDGASWIVIKTVSQQGGGFSYFTFSFTRDKRLRVELYLDLADKGLTKAVFDDLYARKNEFESFIGPIEWERLPDRRASRLAIYHDGYIYDDKKHLELRKWAAETMVKFHNVLAKPVEETINKVLKG